MKIFKIILSVLLVILFLSYILLFTNFGNNIVKPYAEKYIQNKTGYDVKFTKFSINSGSIDINALINNEIMANVNGDYGILNKNFDFNYAINIKDLQSLGLKLDENMSLSGKARGNINKFSLNGSGKFLDSNMRFLMNLKDLQPFSMQIDAKNLNVEKALALAKVPLYAKANMDITADIKNQNNLQNGVVNIKSSNIILNPDAFKDLNITIPNNIKISANSDINITDSIAYGITDITSNLANLSAENEFDIKKQTLALNFNLNAPDLLKFEPIINHQLKGALNVNGNLSVKNKNLEFINATLQGLGGQIITHLKDDILTADIKDIKAGETMALFAIPAAINATINGNAKINNIKKTDNISGTANFKILNASINNKEFKKLTGFELPNDTKFSATSDITIKNAIADISSALTSNILNIPNLTAKYDLNNKNLDTKFSASIDDLSKLETISKQKLTGSAKANGYIKLANNQISNVDINLDAAGGTLQTKGNDKNLNIAAKNLNIDLLFALIGQPAPAKGTLNANAAINGLDIKNLNAKADISVTNGILSKPYMDKLTNKNFPAGTKFNIKANADIKKSVADFLAVADSDLANINKFKGTYNIDTSNLNATYIAEIKDLSKLEFLADRKLKGQILANGDIKYTKPNLSATINSDIFGGKLAAQMINEKINANIKNFQVKGLTDMLVMDHFYDGIGNANFAYNTKNQVGKFDSVINEGKLASKGFIKTVSNFLGRDLSKEVYNNTVVKGNINKNIIDFMAYMRANKSELNVTKGILDTASSKINIPVIANIEKTDLKIDITGTTKEPKYKISSKYLENKINKEIGRGIDKLLGVDKSDNNETKTKKQEQADDVKNILKGLKGLF